MSFHAALTGLLLAPLIPALIVFYFLKLKRPRVLVPSLVLWRQVVNDSRVNSPFQKFKKNILLYLQLLILCLIILAAMQPFSKGGPEPSSNLPVLIDCSASMGAWDAPGGMQRLEEAKKRVRAMIDGMSPGQRLCLVGYANTARRLTGFTDNRRELHDALDQLGVQDTPSDLEDVMRMAGALTRSVEFDRVILLSDGNFPSQANFDLPFQIEYQRLNPGGDNLGVVEFSARRAGKGQWDIFAKIAGSSAKSITASVELFRDGQSLSKEDIAVSYTQHHAFTLRIQAPDARASLMLVLKPDGFDSLAADNIAHLELEPARPLKVWAPMSLVAVRGALRGIEGVDVYPGGPGGDPPELDLVATDNEKDFEQRRARVSALIGAVPKDLAKLVAIQKEGGSFIDWDRNATLLKHVELSDVVLLEDPVAAERSVEGDFEALGYATTAYGRRGPLILEKREGADLRWVLLFHPEQTTLPYRVGFPVLVQNMVNAAMRAAGLAEVRGTRTGVLPPYPADPEADYRLASDLGNVAAISAKASPTGVLTGLSAPKAGRYILSGGSSPDRPIGASLLNQDETGLAHVEKIQFREMDVEAKTGAVPTDHSYWPLLALLALTVAVVEWWWYQGRGL